MNNSLSPLVSVVIPTYNRARYIGETVESVLAQTYDNIEIIVVDDGSTDDTRRVLKPYQEHIIYIYQENQGPSVARNTGIMKSTGPYIAFLDSDDLWMPEKLEIQVAYLNEHPEVGLVHCDFLLQVENPNGPVLKKWPYANNWPSGYVLPFMFVQSMIGTSSVVTRRECFDVAGLFDPRFFGPEDYHLWLRIARHYPITYLDKPLSIYRHHGENLTTNRVGLKREILSVVESFVQENPGLEEEIGVDVVRRGLFDRHYALAYVLYDEGDYKESRPYFAHCIKLQLSHCLSYGYYLVSFLPPAWVRRLRQFKRVLA